MSLREKIDSEPTQIKFIKKVLVKLFFDDLYRYTIIVKPK